MSLPPPNPESPPPNNPDSSPSHFIVEQMVPEGITNTLPIVVTITNHGLSNGQFIRATKFYSFPIALATGMYQLNNLQFMVQLAPQTLLFFAIAMLFLWMVVVTLLGFKEANSRSSDSL